MGWVGGGQGRELCNVALQEKLITQLLPKLDASPYVFRYSWFTAFSYGPGFWSTGLVKPTWGITRRKRCEHTRRIGGAQNGPVMTPAKCAGLARAKAFCNQPLHISV